MATQLEEKSLGQVGFEAYSQMAGGKTFDGRSIPTWDNVGEQVRANWEAAANEIERMILRRIRPESNPRKDES